MELYLLSSTKLDRSMPAPEVRVSTAVVHGRPAYVDLPNLPLAMGVGTRDTGSGMWLTTRTTTLHAFASN